MPKYRQISLVGMGMGFAPTWLRQVSPPPLPGVPASRDHFNHPCLVIVNIPVY